MLIQRPFGNLAASSSWLAITQAAAYTKFQMKIAAARAEASDFISLFLDKEPRNHRIGTFDRLGLGKTFQKHVIDNVG